MLNSVNDVHIIYSFSNPQSARRHELERMMRKSYLEGAAEADAEMRAALRKGYVCVKRPKSIVPQLNRQLHNELEKALKRIIELEGIGSYKNVSSTDKAIERIETYLRKEAYLKGLAVRREQWGENLVLVVYRETGTKDCAKYAECLWMMYTLI